MLYKADVLISFLRVSIGSICRDRERNPIARMGYFEAIHALLPVPCGQESLKLHVLMEPKPESESGYADFYLATQVIGTR